VSKAARLLVDRGAVHVLNCWERYSSHRSYQPATPSDKIPLINTDIVSGWIQHLSSISEPNK
jgi:hypothetical protein